MDTIIAPPGMTLGLIPPTSAGGQYAWRGTAKKHGAHPQKTKSVSFKSRTDTGGSGRRSTKPEWLAKVQAAIF
eukprot:7123200-Karenia_brevis.AAC.1